MKKRMKMKKYDDGGDVDYDEYTTRVTDDEGETLYEKPESKYTESKSRSFGKDKSSKAEPKKAEPKKAEPEEDTSASTDFSKLKRGALKRERTPEEIEENAKRAENLSKGLALALATRGVGMGALGVGKAAEIARKAGYARAAEKAVELTGRGAKRADRIRERSPAMQAEKARSTRQDQSMGYRKGGSIKSSASRRADGIAQRGKTRGRLM